MGFFAPEDLIPTSTTAKGRWALDTDQFVEARAFLRRSSPVTPIWRRPWRACFSWGVAKYKMAVITPKFCGEAYDELTAKFPTSSWTKQADHYRLITK